MDAAIDLTRPRTVRDEPSNARMAVLSILLAWLFRLTVNLSEVMVHRAHHQPAHAGRQLVVNVFGILLTWMLYLLLRRFDAAAISVRLAAAFVASMLVTVVFACCRYYSFIAYPPTPAFGEEGMDLLWMRQHPFPVIVDCALDSYFFITAWAMIYIALSTAAQRRQAERQAEQYRAEAQSAQLRALHYQLNPHFLFNTLNSLSALVLRGTPDEAERMIETLAAFLRTTLVGDPGEDTTLSEEIRVQRLYLDIEQVRFPDRLRVRIDIPSALGSACVPGLLLQPLMENALRYGVAPTIRPVTISVRAHDEGGRLHLEIEDDGAAPPDAGRGAGYGVGLRNVTARLLARFGGAASCTYGPRPEGGFRVDLIMPLQPRSSS